MDIRNKSLELIFIFYNIIIITFYLDYEIYFKLTHENIYVSLPLVYTCKYVYIYIMYIFIESPYCYYYVDIESGFRVSIWVSGIRGFGFGDELSPESVFGSVSGFDFGFRVRVHIDFT